MPEYDPGTPCWVELSSPDVEASAAFYRELMNWSATAAGPTEESGGYRMFQQDGQNIGGLMGHMQEGQPTAWATYISVADADETAEKVKAGGGSVVVEPMDVMHIGRMAFFADPAGAVFGIWQPKTFAGADLVNQPNSVCWNEVLTRDADADKVFYPAVFGWVAGRPSFESAPESYTVWELDGKHVGGMMQMTDERFPPEVPPLERVLRGRRLRRHGRQSPGTRGDDHGATDGYADWPVRRRDRSSGSLVFGEAAGRAYS